MLLPCLCSYLHRSRCTTLVQEQASENERRPDSARETVLQTDRGPSHWWKLTPTTAASIDFGSRLPRATPYNDFLEKRKSHSFALRLYFRLSMFHPGFHLGFHASNMRPDGFVDTLLGFLGRLCLCATVPSSYDMIVLVSATEYNMTLSTSSSGYSFSEVP